MFCRDRTMAGALYLLLIWYFIPKLGNNFLNLKSYYCVNWFRHENSLRREQDNHCAKIAFLFGPCLYFDNWEQNVFQQIKWVFVSKQTLFLYNDVYSHLLLLLIDGFITDNHSFHFANSNSNLFLVYKAFIRWYLGSYNKTSSKQTKESKI